MSGADFIDTNVFVYLFDRRADAKREIADSVVTRALIEGNAHVSHQVVQETLHVITSKITSPVSPDDAWRFFQQFMAPMWKLSPTPDLYRHGLAIQARYGFSFYDSLIVAAAIDAGCSQLLSEDFQHGQRIEGLTVHNPFL